MKWFMGLVESEPQRNTALVLTSKKPLTVKSTALQPL